MTRKEFVIRLSERSGLTYEQTNHCISEVINFIKEELPKGRTIYFRGFGCFTTKIRKAKIAQDIGRKKSMSIPEKRIPYFKPYPDFKESVK